MTSSEPSNIGPITDPEKMRVIRTLACVGITDKMISAAAEKAWTYAHDNPEEIDNFFSMLKLGMHYLLLSESSGNRKN